MTITIHIAYVISVWIIGAITAYPSNKRFFNRFNIEWTNGDMMASVLVCLLFWPIVGMWKPIVKIFNWSRINKKSNI